MEEKNYTHCNFPNAIIEIKDENGLSYHYIDKETVSKLGYFYKLFTCTTAQKKDGLDLYPMENDGKLTSTIFVNILEVFLYKKREIKMENTTKDLYDMTTYYYLLSKWLADEQVIGMVLGKVKELFHSNLERIFTREWFACINNFLVVVDTFGGEYKKSIFIYIADSLCEFIVNKKEVPRRIRELEKNQELNNMIKLISELKLIEYYIIAGFITAREEYQYQKNMD